MKEKATDFKSAVVNKLLTCLNECRLEAKLGDVFNGEVYAYNRILNFVNGLSIEENKNLAA